MIINTEINDPDKLIRSIRNSDEYIKLIFMNGGCYNFYKLLKMIYPSSVPYKVKLYKSSESFDHIITKIGDKYYDINGEIDPIDYYSVELVNNNDIPILETWSFSKNCLLYKLCPNCHEEIYFDSNLNII